MFEFLKVLFNQRGMADVPATASTLSTLDATAMRRTAWKSQYKDDSVRPSVFTAIKTVFNVIGDEIMVLERGTVLDISNLGKAAVGGGQSVRLALRTGFRKAPREGNEEDMLGNEDESGIKYMTAYYNEIKKAYKQNTWGYDFNDLEYLKWNQGNSKLLGQYWSELDDYRYHVALLMGYSPELTKAPVSLVQAFNPNWAVPSLDSASYPTWDVDAVTETDGSADTDSWYSSQLYTGGSSFAENIADAVLSAGTAATATNTNLARIFNWVEDEHVVEPITLDGQTTWLVLLPTAVYNWAFNPANSGGLGDYIDGVTQYTNGKRAAIPGEVGRLWGSYVIVKDPRAPTIVVGGSNGSYTITPGYVRPSNNDDRNRTAWSSTTGSTNYAFDVGAILGADAFVKYTKDELITDLIETTEYKKREGRGSYKGEGIQIGKYDVGTATATSFIYRGSVVIPFARTAV